MFARASLRTIKTTQWEQLRNKSQKETERLLVIGKHRHLFLLGYNGPKIPKPTRPAASIFLSPPQESPLHAPSIKPPLPTRPLAPSLSTVILLTKSYDRSKENIIYSRNYRVRGNFFLEIGASAVSP